MEKYRICFISLIFICISISFSCNSKRDQEVTENIPESEIMEKDYLSLEWVLKNKNEVDSSEYSVSNRKYEETGTMLNKCIELTHQKEYDKALETFEEAISIYPFKELYFYYANALYLASRHEESIGAYGISIELGIDQPQLAYFHIANLYSLLGQSEKAYKSLRQSIDTGFSDFDRIDSSPDLQFLRSQSDWSSKYSKIRGLPENSEYLQMISGKTLSIGSGSTGENYSFCKDQKVVFRQFGGPSSTPVNGHWELKGSVVVITWEIADGNMLQSIDLKDLDSSVGMRGIPQILDYNDCTP